MTTTGSGEGNLVSQPYTVMSAPAMDSKNYAVSDGVVVNQTNMILDHTTQQLVSAGVPSISHDTDIVHNTQYDHSGASTPNLLDQVPSSVPLMARQNQLHISPSTRVVVPAMPTSNTVPEFLYQLTKMLTDNNRGVIEWSNGKIEVHNPHKLQANVLNRYFRHSKFASFQRQLNYFGFRKLAGKGKMAPCSYVNDATTTELGSLLLIKRKTGNEPKSKAGSKRERPEGQSGPVPIQSSSSETAPVNPVLAGILYRSTNDQTSSINLPCVSQSAVVDPNKKNLVGSSTQPQGSQQALARVAVGKGIRHSYTAAYTQSAPSVQNTVITTTPNPLINETPVLASLSALTSNFRNSLQDLESQDAGQKSETEQALHRLTHSNSTGFIPGMLSRDDSLVDLAMIPGVGDSLPVNDVQHTQGGLTFVDFPWQEPSPSDNAPGI